MVTRPGRTYCGWSEDWKSSDIRLQGSGWRALKLSLDSVRLRGGKTGDPLLSFAVSKA